MTGVTPSEIRNSTPAVIDDAGRCPESVILSKSVSRADNERGHVTELEGGGEKLLCIICMDDYRTAILVHDETGHVACCLKCSRILKARGDHCPVCRLPISSVVQIFWA